MTAKNIMIQGTTSDAGKSAIATGLCRILQRQGLKVAPFKPQNMALNSAVTVDGGEIGRAQAEQARACGIEPHTDMNPLLLKPSGERSSQVIVCGKARCEMNAVEFHAYKAELFVEVIAAYNRLASRVDVVVIEGAGSPAEINLRENDIANMGFALAVQSPVLLVADIERGGVFAHIVGTMELLSPAEQALVKGFIINRFRGDMAILQSGLDWLEQRCNRPVMATLPYLHSLYLQAEDSLSARVNTSINNSVNNIAEQSDQVTFRVRIPRLPRLSNQTDFDPLLLNPNIELQFVTDLDSLLPADLLILPGSKNVRADMAWLQENNGLAYINRHLRYGGKVIGICGGYQMLGQRINDPQGVEGEPGSTDGLGILNLETCLARDKQLTYVEGRLFLNDVAFSGYEIHVGVTTGPQVDFPVAKIGDRLDGAVSDDNKVFGCYVHGLFDSPDACEAILSWAGLESSKVVDMRQQQQSGIDLIADTLQQHMTVKTILQTIGIE